METTAAPPASVVRHTLDTVRVLHDTVLALRQAVDTSRQDIVDIQHQFGKPKMDDNLPDEEGEEDVFEDGPPMEDKHQDSEEDIDDIELVFTTGETEPGTIKHDDHLVSIREEGSSRNVHTVVVETDISKCGVQEEHEANLGRRNTLPTPAPYRPILHRELVGSGRARNKPTPFRPVPKQESGAQTDISALPAQWKSETYLAHKISYNLTTLPSKFTLPVPRPTKIAMHDKTQEARRVLLSDINFTSMVPELSRSADHLHKEEDVTQELCKNYPAAFEYMKSFDVGQEGKSSQHCCDLTRHGSRSSWGSYYGSRRFQTSSTSIAPFHFEIEQRRRHSWRPPASANTPCCCHHPVWSSVPSSPTRCPRFPPSEQRRSKHRVMFRSCHPHVHPGQSLPDLRDMDGGDSTDSLIDETEDYLRHQIDALLISRKMGRRRDRRLSDASSLTEFEPPKSSQPFLPRSPRDLKQGYLVKVISGEGRVVVGRVRYSGPVTGRDDPHVGVQLPFPNGFSDGTFLGHRYFECDEDHAIFVPFKKVVIAWST